MLPLIIDGAKTSAKLKGLSKSAPAYPIRTGNTTTAATVVNVLTPFSKIRERDAAKTAISMNPAVDISSYAAIYPAILISGAPDNVGRLFMFASVKFIGN
ncbi:MAG: hypothetical protein GX827_10095 [Clostridiales bacterium]|nr:hypothetical protein [Clostridiales bacterium]